MTTERRPSVTHVLWQGGTGGVERLVHDLSLEQRRAGTAVTVAFGQAQGPFADALARAGVHTLDLGLRSGHDLRPHAIASARALLRAADVLHLHSFNLPLAAVTARLGPALVYTEHGAFGLGRTLGIHGILKRRVQRRFLRDGAGVVAANSEHTAGRARSLYRLDRNVNVVYNGVPVGHAGCAAPQGEELVVAFVGRLAAFKRVDRLIEAFGRATKRDAMRLLIAGPGPLEHELKSLARACGVSDRVEFLGHRSDVEELLSTVDVLVHPSEGEPFGLVIAEACRHGVLPIAFADGGGALEVLPPDGIVVRDVEELSAALDSLVGSSRTGEAARIARAGWLRDTFPIARTARGYDALYKQALA